MGNPDFPTFPVQSQQPEFGSGTYLASNLSTRDLVALGCPSPIGMPPIVTGVTCELRLTQVAFSPAYLFPLVPTHGDGQSPSPSRYPLDMANGRRSISFPQEGNARS